MLNLNLEEIMVEFKNGSIKNVGPTNKSATAKLFDVEAIEAREFGDNRVKIVAEDGEGNTIQIALFPDQVQTVVDDVESMRDESPVFEEESD
jgi:tRNA G37 N-methylase TrmD